MQRRLHGLVPSSYERPVRLCFASFPLLKGQPCLPLHPPVRMFQSSCGSRLFGSRTGLSSVPALALGSLCRAGEPSTDTPPRLTSSFFFFGLLSSPLSSVSDSALRLLPSDFSLSWAVFWD